jgi:DNA-directed RNA polymerase specialized sigma24 family protein
LPEKIADALIYIDMYNMTTAEYARMTGEIESTVRNRINRARATLREKLLLHNEFKEYA